MKALARFVALAALVIVCDQTVRVAYAQSYPARTVRIIVPIAPGGAVDTMARAVSVPLGQALGQAVVIDNRPGANAIIGLELCAKSAPDGYTLCMTNGDSISVNPNLYSKLPYDPARDFAPVIQIGFIETVLAANPAVQVTSLRDLLTLAKSKPGTIAWSSFGSGSIGHLYMEWLKNSTGAVFNHVPYKGAAPALTALLAGEVQVSMVSLGMANPAFKAGRLKPLAMVGTRRSASAPDVPSFSEQGLEFGARGWMGMFAPAGAPRDIVRRLNGEVAKIIAEPRFKDQYLTSQAIVPAGEPPEQFSEFLKIDREDAAKLVKTAGVRLD
jgi:tripartite-type tricarboxylate transporter receptor subunit TctC